MLEESMEKNGIKIKQALATTPYFSERVDDIKRSVALGRLWHILYP